MEAVKTVFLHRLIGEFPKTQNREKFRLSREFYRANRETVGRHQLAPVWRVATDFSADVVWRVIGNCIADTEVIHELTLEFCSCGFPISPVRLVGHQYFWLPNRRPHYRGHEAPGGVRHRRVPSTDLLI